MAAQRDILCCQLGEAICLLTPRLEESHSSRIIAALGYADELAANGVYLTDVAAHEQRNIGGQIPHIIRREVFQHANFLQALRCCVATDDRSCQKWSARVSALPFAHGTRNPEPFYE